MEGGGENPNSFLKSYFLQNLYLLHHCKFLGLNCPGFSKYLDFFSEDKNVYYIMCTMCPFVCVHVCVNVFVHVREREKENACMGVFIYFLAFQIILKIYLFHLAVR